MLAGLTPRLLQTLEYVQEEIERTGVCPNYKQIARAVGVYSASNVNRMVECLIERGYMTKIKAKARSLAIIRPLPTAMRRALERIAAGAPDPQRIALETLQRERAR